MTINVANVRRTVEFNTVLAGAPFLYGDIAYLKLRDAKNFGKHTAVDVGCAIMLSTGNAVGFHGDSEVTPAEFTRVDLWTK